MAWRTAGPASAPPWRESWPVYAAFSLLIAAAYAATALIGLRYAVVPGAGTSVWPAAGVALAALVLGGLRYWPAIVVGRLATAIIVASPTPLWGDLLIAFATTLGAVVPVWLGRRWRVVDPKLGSFRGMLWLTLGGSLGGALVSATLGVLVLGVSGTPAERLADAWQNWASGYFVGALCVTPLILSWAGREAWRMPPLAWAHLLLCLLTVATVSALVFFSPEQMRLRTWHVLPGLVWAALAFHARGTSAALLIVSVLAISGAASSTGPLATASMDPNGRVLLAQQFIALYALTMLFLAGVSEERRDVLGRARLAAIVSTSPEAMITTDPEGKIQSWNLGAEQLFGWKARDVIGRSAFDVLFPDTERAQGEINFRNVLDGSVLRFEAVRRTRDGELVDVSVTAAPLRTSRGAIIGVSTILSDIRQRKAAEAALRALNEELEARVQERTADLRLANASLMSEIEGRRAAEDQVRQLQKMDAIGQLTGGIAHDFNNMLGIVIGALDLLKRRLGTNDAKTAKLLAAACEGADRAAQLTAQLLAFSRRQALSPRVLDPGEQVHRMSDLLRRALGEANRIELSVAPDLWPIRADATQLESAILNLAVNARDAMPGGGRLRIEIANAALGEDYAEAVPDATAGDHVRISVADTGTGMPPDVLARVLEPFFTTKETGKGTGLGLSMVYGFVRQSGGHLSLSSRPGEGTRVDIYLPRWFGEAPAEPDAAGADRAMRGSEVVLVVEDEDRVRALAAEMLSALGYGVLETARAADALAVLKEAPQIALVITDVVMPELNGREFLEQARRLRPGLKALYMTGYALDIVEENAANVPLLSKPFNMEQLGRKVREVLDSARPAEGQRTA